MLRSPLDKIVLQVKAMIHNGGSAKETGHENMRGELSGINEQRSRGDQTPSLQMKSSFSILRRYVPLLAGPAVTYHVLVTYVH
jgi:hypothetical protein